MKKIVLAAAACGVLLAQEAYELDTVSVVGTKSEIKSSLVSQSVAVVSEAELEKRNVMSINDAIRNIPGVLAEGKNGAYDSRLIIRGAGLKAPYGTREIMVMRDGVPMTDPDSFTRFDFIDVDDLEQVEVLKGPGSLEGSGSAGGVISLKSHSVFDTKSSLRLGLGSYSAMNHHLRAAGYIGDSDAVAATLSVRSTNNTWREHNKYDSVQAGIKYGHVFEDESRLEAEVSYTKADLEFGGSMSREQFELFETTGQQRETQDPWKHTGRYSKIFFANLRYDKSLGSVAYKPVFYFNQWEHFHPVTGAIGDKKAFVLGTDQKFEADYAIGGLKSKAVAGITLRTDRSEENNKYEYADVERKSSWGGASKIVATNSDARGDLMEYSDDINDLFGLFIGEQLFVRDDLLLNVNLRYDRSSFDVKGYEYRAFDYASGDYKEGEGAYALEKSFDLYSAKLGLTYMLNDNVNFYVMGALGDQVPTTSEILENRDLKASQTTSFEGGLKVRSARFFADVAIYQMYVEDEVVTKVFDAGYREYANAGKTDKLGAELSLNYIVAEDVGFGASYAFSDYSYDEYIDAGIDYSGNQLKYVPKHQYSLFASYNHANGFKASIDTNTWGEYYVDDINSETYEGYEFITNVMIGYESGAHSFQLNIANLFDEHYANEVKKTTFSPTSAKYYYNAAQPRTAMASYRYNF